MTLLVDANNAWCHFILLHRPLLTFVLSVRRLTLMYIKSFLVFLPFFLSLYLDTVEGKYNYDLCHKLLCGMHAVGVPFAVSIT